jgi:hypothetical protein
MMANMAIADRGEVVLHVHVAEAVAIFRRMVARYVSTNIGIPCASPS